MSHYFLFILFHSHLIKLFVCLLFRNSVHMFCVWYIYISVLMIFSLIYMPLFFYILIHVSLRVRHINLNISCIILGMRRRQRFSTAFGVDRIRSSCKEVTRMRVNFASFGSARLGAATARQSTAVTRGRPWITRACVHNSRGGTMSLLLNALEDARRGRQRLP